MFTYRDFEGGTLGLAWTGDMKNAGGVCERNGVSLTEKKPKKKKKGICIFFAVNSYHRVYLLKMALLLRSECKISDTYRPANPNVHFWLF